MFISTLPILLSLQMSFRDISFYAKNILHSGVQFGFEIWLLLRISDSEASSHGPLTRYVKLRAAHAPGMPGTFSLHRLQRKPHVP